jgi:hypothetical protein
MYKIDPMAAEHTILPGVAEMSQIRHGAPKCFAAHNFPLGE